MTMLKVFPQCILPSTSSFSNLKETLTIWMKSLVMNGYGCTVYNSDGHIVYRVDNYHYKSSDEVYIIDQGGITLAQIHRKKFSILREWEGFRCKGSVPEKPKPWFRMQTNIQILHKDQSYKHKVTVGYGSSSPICYHIVGSAKKTDYKIMNMAGQILAEVEGKHTASGVSLGNDVLTLTVEANVDQLLIIGIVVVRGLINRVL